MRKPSRPKFENLAGQSFGNITVLERLSVEIKDDKRTETYRCLCEACGKEVQFTRFDLLHCPNRQSCGCRMVIMKPGVVINAIKALMPVEGGRQWFCRCLKCGDLLAMRPEQFKLSFDEEGCAECRQKERIKKTPQKITRQKRQCDMPPVKRSSFAETADINTFKETARKRGMSYGQYSAVLRPVTINKAPRHYLSYNERQAIKEAKGK